MRLRQLALVFPFFALIASAIGAAADSPPLTGSWGQPADTDSTRSGATIVGLPNGTVLAVGGYTVRGAAVNGGDLYDPGANAWKAVSPMPGPRAQASATALPDGSVLLVGGFDQNGPTDTAVIRLASGTWVAAGHMSAARYQHQAVLLKDGRVLILGGFGGANGPLLGSSRLVSPSSQPQLLATAELFDPTARAWSAPFPMPAALSAFASTVLPDGDVLIAGGYRPNGNTALADAWLFHPTTGRWSRAHPMLEPRAFGVAVVLKTGQVIVAGGPIAVPGINPPSGSAATPTAELYDPVANSWSLAPPPPLPINDAAAAIRLPDGRALFFHQEAQVGTGGQLSGVIYDPATRRWSTTPSTPPSISSHSLGNVQAVGLAGGKVLVLLDTRSILLDPNGTAEVPAGSQPRPAENPLNSPALTPYLLLAALFFLLVLSARFAHTQLTQRRRPS